MILTASQLLTEWKLRQGLLPLRSDATITRTDGYDLDSLLMAQVYEWYTDCLYTMPPSHLPLQDIASQLTLTRTDDGVGRVLLPERCARVTNVFMPGWRREAHIVSPQSVEATAQLSPYSRGDCNMPVVVATEYSMCLYTPPRGATSLGTVMAALLPEKNTFPVTEPMMAAMPRTV